MQVRTKYKELIKIIKEACLLIPSSKENDQRPMKEWWAEYKKEEKELEERKMNLHKY